MIPVESTITVNLEKIPPLAELAVLWRELESRSAPSFFLTWSWVGNWLTSLGEHAGKGWVLSASEKGRLVGLALVFDAPIRRRLLPIGRGAYINETGFPNFDALTIEHNGLLVDAQSSPAVHQAMFERVCVEGSKWREVHLRYATAVCQELVPQETDAISSRGRRNECCLVDLARVRERDGDYLGLLGSGRRAHIRRCLRAYAAIGQLKLTVAHDVPTALQFFNRMVELHDHRFAERGGKSDFSNSFCRSFHERLVAGAHPRGEVQLLQVSSGDSDLGYLYCFVYQGRVSFYQSGFNYRLLDKRFSPGLVTLVMAIEHYSAKGLRWFDFLAGNQAYKFTLATDRCVMVSWKLQRRSLLSATESALRWKLTLVRRVLANARSWVGRKKIVPSAGAIVVAALNALYPELALAEGSDAIRLLAANGPWLT